jgi:hypothetical protein
MLSSPPMVETIAFTSLLLNHDIRSSALASGFSYIHFGSLIVYFPSITFTQNAFSNCILPIAYLSGINQGHPQDSDNANTVSPAFNLYGFLYISYIS